MEELLASQRADATTIANVVVNLKKKGVPNYTLGLVESRMTYLNTRWAEFRERHWKLLKLHEEEEEEEEDSYFADGKYDQVEEQYIDNWGELLDIKARLVPPPEAPRVEIPEPPRVESQPPRLSLPKFSGDSKDWRNFKDLFESMIATRRDIPRVQKLQHLKTCLSAEPAQLLANLPVNADNYEVAWAALVRRYDNKRLLVNSHFSALCNIKPANAESTQDLRRIYNTTVEAIGALRSLDCPVEHWDVPLVYLTLQKLDLQTRRDWETANGAEMEPIRFQRLSEFIEARIRALEAMPSPAKPTSSPSYPSKAGKPPSFSNNQLRPGRHNGSNSFHSSTSRSTSDPPPVRQCSLCQKNHYLTACPGFNSKSIAERKELVNRMGLCFNCLGNHAVKFCRSEKRCQKCQARHNTMLHADDTARSPPLDSSATARVPPTEAGTQGAPPSSEDPSVVTYMARYARRARAILLATARVIVIGPSGHCQGYSDWPFWPLLPKAVAQILRLPKVRTHVPLVGISAAQTGTAKYASTVAISSAADPGLNLTADVLILPKLTNVVPSTKIVDPDLTALDGFSLADPDYGRQVGVGMIIGADLYGSILRDGLITLKPTALVAQNTAFGWVLSGPTLPPSTPESPSLPLTAASSYHCVTNDDVFQALQRFWDIEEVPDPKPIMRPDDEWCERHFQDTHSRDDSGRYIVRLPFKDHRPTSGTESRTIAERSLHSLQRRLQRDPELKEHYDRFMSDYETLGHMTAIPPERTVPPLTWYIPHHPVLQFMGSRMKLRVVFDAARRLSSGQALNDFLHSGPSLQNELFLVILRWRFPRFVFTADMIKMFRQILLHPDDQKLIRILWGESGTDSVTDYTLRTVTYGTRCAPFLAIRTLRQLAQDEGHNFPLGADALLSHTYMDDTYAGADDLPSAIQIRDQLVNILALAGFKLDKWSANHPALLKDVPSASSTQSVERVFDLGEPVKTLGLSWIPSKDSFGYKLPPLADDPQFNGTQPPTKRRVLSSIARVFDPLGWVSPVVITAKILMQDLWLLGVDWDVPLPPHVAERWGSYLKSLFELPLVKIKRWVNFTAAAQDLQIHAFSDASTRAYASTIFLRLVTETGEVKVFLLTSKAKVSPVKTVSVPRLELCSAVLMVKLLLQIRRLPQLETVPITAWMDSQVALSWIKKHPSSWTTFVANRVSFIQSSLPSVTWNYVPTSENPADLATRGCTPLVLSNSKLWWNGPKWLCSSPGYWPLQSVEPDSTRLEEKKEKFVGVCSDPEEFILELLNRYSSLDKLLRVASYCLRLSKILRTQCPSFNSSFITVGELRSTLLALIRQVQAHEFPLEIAAVKSNRPLPRGSPLANLSPFLDEAGTLRVGGRLQNSYLSFNEKHPPILPKTSRLSRLLIERAHLQAMHGGPTLTLGILHKLVWIVGAKVLVKAHIRSCVVCHRQNPRLGTQKMSALPTPRITPSRPFSTAGLDYAGPVSLLCSRTRGQKTYKGYICLFICFVTKAIHLEAVSDATSQAFLAAFRRFCGRRGIPSDLHSDNGTTFKGADVELRALFRASSKFYEEVSESLAKDGTSWHFIPPHSPHFGGLWEAGVKSVKFHLKRVVGDQHMTFEELTTVLVQVESCLNSRPLCPMSSDPDDLEILTPAHFITGSSLFTIPEPGLTDVPMNHLGRWQLRQRMYQDFWARWSREYVHHLQQRTKWRTPQDNFRIGELVLIQDERYPPSKWALGRVLETHPGNDGLVRAVTLKTASSTLKRSIAKLSALPISLPDPPSL